MMCEHCGKKNATFYYKSNVNGKVSEQHLCEDCARELGYMDRVGSSFANFGNFNQKFFGDFDDFFSPMPMLAGNLFEPFESIFEGHRAMPTLRPAENVSEADDKNATVRKVPNAQSPEDLVSHEESRKLNRERQLNALRCELQQAIETENFEHAAELRDQIHGLENNG